MKSWQLQEAKAHLSQVVQDAIHQGPQSISLRGEAVVIMISIDEYEKLSKPKPSLVEFMRRSPLVGIDIEISRDRSKVRKVDL